MQRASRTTMLLTAAMASVLASEATLHGEPAPIRKHASSSIRIWFDGETVTATLEAGEASRAFRALLPLTLTLKDYNGTEKIGDLPKHLPVQGEPAGADPEPGDLAYYAPWGNLAIYHKDFGYSPGLVRLGRLSRIPDALRQSSPVKVTIEAAP